MTETTFRRRVSSTPRTYIQRHNAHSLKKALKLGVIAHCAFTTRRDFVKSPRHLRRMDVLGHIFANKSVVAFIILKIEPCFGVRGSCAFFASTRFTRMPSVVKMPPFSMGVCELSKFMAENESPHWYLCIFIGFTFFDRIPFNKEGYL